MFQSAHPGPGVILNGELSASGPDPDIPEIEYAPAVMESVRAEAVDGLMKLGRGGIECGGVLYGRITDDLIRILAARPLECEHRLGPSFVLSENDEARLREMMEPAGRDDETRDLDVVGWYMSHCRRGLPLAESDVRIFDRYFPKPGNVTAIVMPQKLGSATVGFFIRGRNGDVRTDVPAVQESLAGPAELVLAAAPPQPPSTAPAALVPATRSLEAPVAPVNGSVTGDRDAPSKLQLYLQQQEKHRRVSTWNLVITMAVLVVLAVGGLYLWMRPGVPDTPAAIPLRVSDSGAQIRVEWDSRSPSVQTAVSGLLEMREADGATVRLDLPPDVLRTGSAIYTRHTDKLEIRLKLLYAKAPAFDSVVYFINPLTSAAQHAQTAPPPQPAVVAKVEPPVVKTPDPQAPPAKPRTFEPPKVTPNTATTSASAASTPLPAGNISVPTQAPPVSLPFSAGPAIAPPPPVVVAPAPVAKTNPEPPARPRSGRLIWTGDLAKNALLSFTSTGASAGWVNGRLPGVPIKVSVYPAELVPGGIQVYSADPKQPTTTESPSAQNGWNTVVHRYDAKHISDIRIVSAPSAENSWSQLVVQNGKRPVTVLVINWTSVAAQ